MGRNRKQQPGVIRFGMAIRAVIACLFIGGSAIGYVILKKQIFELGKQIKEKELTLQRLVWENNARSIQLAGLEDPNALAERVRDQKLDLVMPEPWQIVWLQEPSTANLTNSTPGRMVSAGGGNHF